MHLPARTFLHVVSTGLPLRLLYHTSVHLPVHGVFHTPSLYRTRKAARVHATRSILAYITVFRTYIAFINKCRTYITAAVWIASTCSDCCGAHSPGYVSQEQKLLANYKHMPGNDRCCSNPCLRKGTTAQTGTARLHLEP